MMQCLRTGYLDLRELVGWGFDVFGSPHEGRCTTEPSPPGLHAPPPAYLEHRPAPSLCVEAGTNRGCVERNTTDRSEQNDYQIRRRGKIDT